MAAYRLAKTWLSIPLFMAFFLAGLQGLPKEQVEAARVDGANNCGVLRYRRPAASAARPSWSCWFWARWATCSSST